MPNIGKGFEVKVLKLMKGVIVKFSKKYDYF